MEEALAALERSALPVALRGSRWGYAAVNASHIFGIALLIGSIVPLNLRLLGLWPDLPRAVLVRALVPVAATGLALALAAGALLFATRAAEYASVGFLQIKLVLIAVATLSAILLHLRHGLFLSEAKGPVLAGHAMVSLICWPTILVLGRLIAFAGD